MPFKPKTIFFTKAAKDNLDVNSSSATVMPAFHKAATSLNQHILVTILVALVIYLMHCLAVQS